MPSPTAAPSSPVYPSRAAEPPKPEPLVPLSDVPVGWRRVVVSVEGPDDADLAHEGVLPGGIVVVTARTPLGGPLVVELGRVRLALSSRVASQVTTRPYAAADEPAR